MRPVYSDGLSAKTRHLSTTQRNLYQSHEYSLTVAGAKLLHAIKKAWPEWDKHLYTGWDYVRPAVDI